MAVTWVLVADSSRARIFSKNGRDPLMEVSGFIHPESRLHEQALTSDLPGSASSRVGNERHGVGSAKVRPKRHEAITFSKQVTDHLESARTDGKFHRLLVIAPPAFLGMLRDQFGPALAGLVADEVNKNLVSARVEEIRDQLNVRV